jgi:hypothetical protein
MWKALRNSRLAGARDRSASPRDAGAEASGTGGVIKEPPMEIIGKCLTADEFVAYVEQLSIPEPRPTRVFLHHTWKPTPETWHGYDTILAMKSYYERQPWTDLDGREHEGWTVGPHVFVAPDGIWLFSDLRYDGVGVYGHNYRSRHVEMVGNYDPAPPSGSILADTVAVLGILHERLGLSVSDLAFHRDFSTKTCPGVAVQKPWMQGLVQQWLAEYRRARAEKMAAARRAVTARVQNLLVQANPNFVLSKEATRRGLVGPISHEIPIELDNKAYVVQFFAEALLVPVPEWKGAQSLHEYEEMDWGRALQEPTQAAPTEGAEGTLLDMPPTPEDPFPYTPR